MNIKSHMHGVTSVRVEMIRYQPNTGFHVGKLVVRQANVEQEFNLFSKIGPFESQQLLGGADAIPADRVASTWLGYVKQIEACVENHDGSRWFSLIVTMEGGEMVLNMFPAEGVELKEPRPVLFPAGKAEVVAA